MLTGLDVRFGKTFTRYSPAPGRRVTAHFADGSSAVGDLLAGADGTWSAVRRQMLPDAVIDELGWAVHGRTPFADWVPGVLIDTFNRVTIRRRLFPRRCLTSWAMPGRSMSGPASQAPSRC